MINEGEYILEVISVSQKYLIQLEYISFGLRIITKKG